VNNNKVIDNKGYSPYKSKDNKINSNESSLNNSMNNNNNDGSDNNSGNNNKPLFSGRTIGYDSLYNKKESYDPLNRSQLNPADAKLSQNTMKLMQLEDRIMGLEVNILSSIGNLC
jgi:hypothetical protein